MIRLVALSAVLALAPPAFAQDAPVTTAPAAAPPLAGGPAAVRPTKPPTLVEALIAAGFDPHTKLIGDAVQVMSGQRATLDVAEGKLTLDAVDTGHVDMALPDGTPDTYKPVAPGKVAFAVDGSAAKKQSFLKIWNGLAHAVSYEAELTAIRGGKLAKRKAQVCAVPGGGTNYEMWSDPIIAVTLSRIAEVPDDKINCK
ncbi:MAG: hypothetical protein KA085_05765 [Phenylobacterium sp.]|uniref:hypothetical protein n=1 Tax=Phenylobacterium sp. TaxID=1871053 RepID=UPI001B62F1BF|nr:hypothetical protein [Phenylobacterium sp.]MBP7650048.1 hypothetical protein [Phenylobacterium sp.]MBP7815612.1 hypothetical protein [Phenylobacterium sp.]